MAGIIYLKTDRFEVKLEGITFKAKDFELLCTLDFLFPDGKVWSRPPVVGFDIIRHPRDNNAILLLLCVGIGCLILRFRAGDPLPNPIFKFLTDERIRFVGFGIPRKSDIFPYQDLGLTRRKNDIGYLAASKLNDSAYKRSELKHLARKILGIKKMVGLTDASSFERHEHIKCVICQLFITSVIGMALFRAKDQKKLEDSPNLMSFIKSFNSLPLLNEGWLKFPKLKKDNKSSSPRVAEKLKNATPVKVRPKETKTHYVKTNAKPDKEGTFVDDVDMNARIQDLNDGIIRLEKQDNMASFIDRIDISDEIIVEESPKEESTNNEYGNRKCIEDLVNNGEFTFDDLFDSPKEINGVQGGEDDSSDDDFSKNVSKRPLKGILRCPSSTRLEQMDSPISPITSCKEPTTPVKGILKCPSSSRLDHMEVVSPIPSYKEPTTPSSLRRANSKGLNVSFAFKL